MLTSKFLLPLVLVMACTGVLFSDKAMAAELPNGDTTVITVEQYVNPSDPTGSYVKITQKGYDEPLEFLFEDYREDLPGYQVDTYKIFMDIVDPEKIVDLGNAGGNVRIYLNTRDYITIDINGDETWTPLPDLPSITLVKPSVPPTQGIPEFPTIALPVLAVLGLALVFQRRK